MGGWLSDAGCPDHETAGGQGGSDEVVGEVSNSWESGWSVACGRTWVALGANFRARNDIFVCKREAEVNWSGVP